MTDKIIRTDAENTSEGPHMLNAIPPVRVEAGQSVQDVEMAESEFDAAKKFGIFKFTGKTTTKATVAPPAPKD